MGIAESTDWYDTTTSPSKRNLDWLGKISGGRPITDISIPGTHNSMEYHSLAYSRCQSWSLDDQLDAGIRFLDIRLKVDEKGNLQIHNSFGSPRRNMEFEYVLRKCFKFLNSNGKETILMRLGCINQSIDRDIIREHVTALGENRFWIRENIPLLSDVRGKIVLLRDFKGDYGIPYDKFNIADSCLVTSIVPYHINMKWENVKENIDRARKGSDGYITFTSGRSPLAYPYSVAYRINYTLWGYIDKNKQHGILAMDFPGQALIRDIILSNH